MREEKEKLMDVFITKNGVRVEDQKEGVQQFLKACGKSMPSFPGTASAYASRSGMAVTDDWKRGWNACLDVLDRRGWFNESNKELP